MEFEYEHDRSFIEPGIFKKNNRIDRTHPQLADEKRQNGGSYL